MRPSRTLLNALSGLEPAAVGSTSSATPGKFLPPVFNRIVLDAAIAQPSSTPTPTDEPSTTTVRAPNPFLGHKNPRLGCHAPPRISLRRQADLVKIYPSSYLPSGPKNQHPTTDAQTDAETIQYEEDRLTITWLGTPSQRSASRAARFSKSKSSDDASSRPTEERGESLKSGPYAGRQHQPKLFKGHKHDRQRVERREETKTRMEGMEGRIADWRKSKLDAIASAKPSLPF
ncbi:hypothetical protein QFC20_005077 [Naganishia adeliensis]|uniref:Uncharacterized protein n=1 Tax=Naganishia adeliensis TaxID=92952 RepID=A0ACC2VRP2_9TREE|nr:hypothetical protein QFC20_005077 [Naganishia adeliensis]